MDLANIIIMSLVLLSPMPVSFEKLVAQRGLDEKLLRKRSGSYK